MGIRASRSTRSSGASKCGTNPCLEQDPLGHITVERIVGKTNDDDDYSACKCKLISVFALYMIPGAHNYTLLFSIATGHYWIPPPPPFACMTGNHVAFHHMIPHAEANLVFKLATNN